MKFTQNYGGLFKNPIALGIFFLLFSFCFFFGYIVFEYERYANQYHLKQQEERLFLEQKVSQVLGDLKKVSHLTGVRIAAANGDLKRIEIILNSFFRFYGDQELPKFKDISYHKLTSPQFTVTRFGELSTPPKQSVPKDKLKGETSIVFEKDDVIAKTFIVKNQSLEGFLEIRLTLAVLKAFLGHFETLGFQAISTSHRPLQEKPFSIYGKSANDFWVFFTFNAFRYAIFLSYMMASIIVMVFLSVYVHLHFKKKNQEMIKQLERGIHSLKTEKENVEKTFLLSQQEYEVLQTSFASYKKMHLNFVSHEKEQFQHLASSLEKLKGSAEEKENSELLTLWLKILVPLSKGYVVSTMPETLNLKNILEEVLFLFAEKIYKFALNVEFICPATLSFKGDYLCTIQILLTLLGKSFHRVPKNGKVSIVAKEKDDSLHLEIQDNGYSLANKEALLKKSLVFLLPNDAFQHMCQANSFIYESQKTADSLNSATLLIPRTFIKTIPHNVIQLFK